MKNLLPRSAIEMDWDEMARLMGYPSVTRMSDAVRDVCRDQIRRLPTLADPWGSCLEVPIRKWDQDSIRLEGGHQLSSHRLAILLRRAVAIDLVLVSLGERISPAVRALVDEGKMIEAMALDAAATVATNALMRRMREHVCRQALDRGLGATIRYGPGYTDWKLEDIAILFSYLRDRDVPVRLNEQMMLVPEKSLLCVIGLVPGKKSAPDVIPCRICDLQHCTARRAPFTGHP